MSAAPAGDASGGRLWYVRDSLRTNDPTAAPRAQPLPSPEQAEVLVPGPDSVTWRIAADARVMATAGYALLLQVAHPTVGAGVAEHSNFKADPWGRLLRTLDYTTIMTYGGARLASETGRRVRDMHKQIRGKLPDGSPYYALEPRAFAWVHATLADAIVTGHERFGLRIQEAEIEAFWREWRLLGRLVGVRVSELPEEWAGFRPYFDSMVADELEDNETVQDVLESLAAPAAPPLPMLGGRAWRALRFPAARLGSLATVGLIPPLLRRRFGLEWSRGKDLELRAMAAVSRRLTPLMPPSLRNFGPAYIRMRRKAIDRGEVASGGTAPVAA